MADWNTPTVTTNYVTLLSELKDRDLDVAKMFAAAPTNPADDMIRFSRSGNSGKFQQYGSSTWTDQLISVEGGGTGAATAGDARTNLGLGTLATQNSNSVTITGGVLSGLTSVTAGSFVGALTGNASTATSATNATTVTNGVYTTGSYANPAWITELAATKLTGTIADARLSSNVIVAGAGGDTPSGVVTVATQPRKKVYASGNTSLTANTWTDISGFDAVAWGDDYLLLPGIVEIPAAPVIDLWHCGTGMYLLHCQATLLATSATVAKLALSDTSGATEGTVIARDERIPSATEPIILRLSTLIEVSSHADGKWYLKAYVKGAAGTIYGAGVGNTYIEAVKLW